MVDWIAVLSCLLGTLIHEIMEPALVDRCDWRVAADNSPQHVHSESGDAKRTRFKGVRWQILRIELKRLPSRHSFRLTTQ